MNPGTGSTLRERVVAWWRGLFGAGQDAPGQQGERRTPIQGEGSGQRESALDAARDGAASVGDRSARAAGDVADRVSTINTDMRERAGKIVRPLEETDAPPQGATRASEDEFARGGYAAGATAPADVAAAADDTASRETAETTADDSVGIPPDSDDSGTGATIEPAESAATASTYASRVDDVTSGEDAPARADDSGAPGPTWSADTAAALEDTPAATRQDTDDFLESGMTGADTEAADAGRPVGQGVTFDTEDAASGAPPVYEEGTGGSATIRPAGAAALEGEPPAGTDGPFGNADGGGTYAATAGDIAEAGPSTGDDLGIDSSADLDASELGSLEDVEGAGAPDAAQAARLGSRHGADLSRTGLYADIRGDADAVTFDAADTPSTAAPAGPTGTPIEETVAGRGAAEATDDAGNQEATAGDDYSAERSADMMAGTSPESTTTSAIGEEMASGEEADDLVGEPPAATPSPGVAVDMDAEAQPEGSGGYSGAVRGDGTANTPPGYPIKGNGSSMIYHTPDMPSYRGTKPEWCFATVEDAQAAGFRAPRARNLAGSAGPAASAPAGSAGDTGSGIVDPHVVGRNPEPKDVAPTSDMTDSLNRYSDPQVSGGGRLTEEVMDANTAGDPFGTGEDDVESLQTSPPDDVAAKADGAPTEAPAAGTAATTLAGAVQGDGTRTCPTGYPIKGNASSKIYHVPGAGSYENTIPEWCFATEEDAQNAGYRAPRR